LDSATSIQNLAAQHALAPDAAPLRCAAQVKRRTLGADRMNFEKGKVLGLMDGCCLA